ncbi:Metallopeptidase, catalytic domain protein, partial [Metarhizium majus ARSEF 297]
MRLLAYRAETRADHGPADRMDEFFKRSDRPAWDAVTRTFRDVGAECTLNTMALTYPRPEPDCALRPLLVLYSHGAGGVPLGRPRRRARPRGHAPGAGAARHWQRLQLLLPRWEFRRDQSQPR